MKLPKLKVPPKMSRFFGQAARKLKGLSPDLLIIGGVITGAAALGTAIRATWKSKEKLEEDVLKIKAKKAAGTSLNPVTTKDEETGEQHTELIETKRTLTKEEKKAIAAARIDFVKDIFKTYWLTGALGLGSVAMTLGGKAKYRKEVVLLSGMVAALNKKNTELIKRIREKYGEKEAEELLYGVKIGDNDILDQESGKIIATNVPGKSSENLSPYAFYFNEGEWDDDGGQWIWRNTVWRGSKLYDQVRVMEAQNLFDSLLTTRGWVLLYEIEDFLGAKPSKYGHRYGWTRKKGEEKHIELGVLESAWQLECNKGFMDDLNPQTWCIIEPNVDGDISYIFEDIEQYDKRVGKHLPSNAEMFGVEYARKLLK